MATQAEARNAYDVWSWLGSGGRWYEFGYPRDAYGNMPTFYEYVGWSFEEWRSFYADHKFNGPVPDRPLKAWRPDNDD